MYLDHLAACDACCGEIARRSGAVFGPSRDREGGGGEQLGDWLDKLKQETAYAPDEEDVAIGEWLGPFRISAVLGEGASSVVFEAVDEGLGRRVVLKVWRSAQGDDAERRRLIVAEARALAAVQHDAIMPLLQLLWHDRLPVLVFPRLPGETFADALAAGRLTWREGLDIVRQVARGLAHAHALGIVHHDVKPSNIWLHKPPDGSRTSALLFDFGLAGAATESSGTPGYADPVAESARDPESGDLFSLGVVLHECLARAPGAPRECRSLVRRLTSSPAERRPAASAVAAELDRMLRPAGRARLATSAILSLVALALAGLFFVGPGVPSALRRSAETGPLAPESILPPRGLPVAFSSDGTIECFVEEGPSLRVWNLVTDESVASIPLPFRPDRVVLSPDHTLVALGHVDGDVGIVDVPNARLLTTHRFEGGVSWMGWSGWKRDVLAILSAGEVQGFFFRTRRARRGDEAVACDLVPSLRGGVFKVASFAGSEAMASLDDEGVVTVWSVGTLTSDTVYPGRMVKDPTDLAEFGWKSAGVCYTAEGRTVREFASHHTIHSYVLPAPVSAIRWLSDSEYVLLSLRKDGRSRLLLGNSRHPDSCRECDPGDEPLERIEVLEDQRQVVAITRSGGARVYRVRP